MAIVINGSGTITGISAGGLPDGSVDSDTLATGIDAAKLADGTITNSELQYINSLSSNAQTQISAAGGTDNASSAFFVYNASNVVNTTGDGTLYDLMGGGLTWTELYDVGSDVSSGTFTAPTTGKYFLHVTMTVELMNSDHDNVCGFIVTSNRTYTVFYQDTYLGTRDHHMLASSGIIVDMDASDTAKLSIQIYGGTKTVTLKGMDSWHRGCTFGGFFIG